MSSRENSNQPDEFILVITTTNSLDEAKILADQIIKGNWAACVSISSPVLSVYKWQNKIEHEDEFMLLIKTVHDNYTALETLISEHHSYEVPEIIAVPLSEIEESYSRWVQQNSERKES